MDTKFLIFVAISALLIAAIYSSSTYFIFAEIYTSCSYSSKTTSSCRTWDSETPGDEGVSDWNCTKNKDGKTWSCTKAQAMAASSISPELGNALDIAVEESQKTTKVPKDFDLKKGDLLTKDSQITTDEESSKTPPPCPLEGPIPPNCTMKPPIE